MAGEREGAQGVLRNRPFSTWRNLEEDLQGDAVRFSALLDLFADDHRLLFLPELLVQKLRDCSHCSIVGTELILGWISRFRGRNVRAQTGALSKSLLKTPLLRNSYNVLIGSKLEM